MSMSTWVELIRPPDKKWLKMKAAYDACGEAGVEVPETIDDFFDHQPPDEFGVRVKKAPKGCITDLDRDCQAGMEVDITKLPPDVTIVRFVNAW